MSAPTMRRRDDESGAVAIMAAVLVLAVLVATSLAVDVGRAAFVSRDQQGVTDRAALDAMTVVSTAFDSGISTLAGLHDAVEVEVDQSLTRNPGTDGGTARDRDPLLVELGRVEGGAFSSMCSEPFDLGAPATCTGDVDGDTVPDFEVVDVTSVRVVTESFVPFVFAIGDAEGGRVVTREAVAESMALGSITVGSELAGISGGLVEDALNGTICAIVENTGDPSCTLDVSAAGYQGLATTDIQLGALVEQLEVVAGSPDAGLTSEVTAAQFLTAAANVLDNQGRPDEAQVLRDIVLELPTDDLHHDLFGIIAMDTTTPDRAADATVNVLELVRGSLQVANGTNLLALPDLSAHLPLGLGSVTGDLSVIEAPSTAIGPVGDGHTTTAHTGQVVANLQTQLLTGTGPGQVDLVGAVGSLLSSLNLGSVTISPVTLPIGAEAAGATARLADIVCQEPEPDTVTQTSTDVARLVLGHLAPDGTLTAADLTTVEVTVRGGLLNLPILRVTLDVDAAVDLPVGGTTGPEHQFDASQFTGETPDVNQLTYPRGAHRTAGSILDTGDVNATTVDLTINSTYTVLGLLPLPLGSLLTTIVDGVEQALVTSLLPLLTNTVSGVVDPLLHSLGVGLGNADTWANWAHCDGRRLSWIDPTP